MKISVMNRSPAKIWFLCCLLLIAQKAFTNDYGLLHINKHYFTVGERIWYAGYLGQNTLSLSASSITVKLFRLEEDHLKMVKAEKISISQNVSAGYLDIPDGIRGGRYMLGLFAQGMEKDQMPLLSQQILIYNPEEEDRYRETSSPADKTWSSEPDDIHQDAHVIIELESDTISNGQVRVSGRVSHKLEITETAILSVSVIDKDHINEKALRDASLNKELRMEDPSEVNPSDKYIAGKLYIDEAPGALEKVYFFAYQAKDIILDYYITSREGNFYFPNTPYRNTYDVKLMTNPDPGRSYRFTMTNQYNLDSILHYDLAPVQFDKADRFVEQAMNEYLIRSSYLPALLEDDSLELNVSDLVEPSKTVILSEYIAFPTLPEVIREIVPYATIRYKKGQYILRINDQRVREFCCVDNPLIFVNNEPYLEVSEMMNIKPDDIHSIGVVRPVEAIKAFGDIGMNGILLVNLKSDTQEELIESPGKAYFRLLGEQTTETYENPLPVNAPDFRSFLYWESGIRTGVNGDFFFDFKPSLRQGNYCVFICGLMENGTLFYRIIDL